MLVPVSGCFGCCSHFNHILADGLQLTPAFPGTSTLIFRGVFHTAVMSQQKTMRLFDHLDMRVRDMREAEAFYDLVLPALGFPTKGNTTHCIYYEALSGHPKPEFVALIEERSYIASSTRIAFWSESCEEVDRMGAVLLKAGAKNLEGPMFCPEYSPTYYAAFFEDPSGNRLEVACRVAKQKKAAPSTG